MRWIVLLPVIVILFVVYKVIVKIRDKAETNNVIKMSLRGNNVKSPKKQTCSFCRNKEKKLSFYSDEQGRVIGVCKQCKPLAERRALMRL